MNSAILVNLNSVIKLLRTYRHKTRLEVRGVEVELASGSPYWPGDLPFVRSLHNGYMLVRQPFDARFITMRQFRRAVALSDVTSIALVDQC